MESIEYVFKIERARRLISNASTYLNYFVLDRPRQDPVPKYADDCRWTAEYVDSGLHAIYVGALAFQQPMVEEYVQVLEIATKGGEKMLAARVDPVRTFLLALAEGLPHPPDHFPAAYLLYCEKAPPPHKSEAEFAKFWEEIGKANRLWLLEELNGEKPNIVAEIDAINIDDLFVGSPKVFDPELMARIRALAERWDTVEDIYEGYLRFLRQFWAAGGPHRDLMTLDEFSSWWAKLKDDQRENYLSEYKKGYQEPGDDSQTAEIIEQNMAMALQPGAIVKRP